MGQQRVSRRSSHSFSHTVKETKKEDVDIGGRQSDEGPGEGGESVTEKDGAFPPSETVGKPAGKEL